MFTSACEIPIGAGFRVLIYEGGLVRLDDRNATAKTCRQELLEGPVRGLALFTQGQLVLHGSCLEIGGNIVSLVGRSGAGKSTLAALLCRRGATLIYDGMTPVHPKTLHVALGPARTKLNDESLRLMGEQPETYPLVHPESLKHYFPVQGAESGFKLKLVLIVVDAGETSIAPMPGAESLMKLITNVYLVEHLPPEHSPILMQRAAMLIQNGVQVKALRRRRDPSQLTAIAECIENAVRELA